MTAFEAMSTPERPAKRTRQACEPCRRKKSRCPGEKPTCSHCARLSQICTYATDRTDRTDQQIDLDSDLRHATNEHKPTADAATADRLVMLERGMAQIQTMLNSQSNVGFTTPHQESPIRTQRSPGQRATHHSISDLSEKPPARELETAAALYAKYCDCQPLPLFPMKGWAQSLASKNIELQQAIIVLVDRFKDVAEISSAEHRSLYLESARRLSMMRLVEGTVELSTVQTLCILSLIEFNDNATARASSYSTLAWDLAQSAGLVSELPFSQPSGVLEERRRCYWSVVLLKNLFGNLSGTLILVGGEMLPKFPESAQPPAGSSSNVVEPGLPQPDSTTDNLLNVGVDDGILAYVIDMSSIWGRTVRYAALRGKRQQPPSWAPESEYQQILAQLMRFEARMPYKYRYKPARIETYNEQEIQQHRAFWAPWYLNQMLYHSLLCLLNHPLVLSLQLRNYKMTMVPEVFLQHTDALIQTHTGWVIHLIDQAYTKNFTFSDPYPSYCVAVVATIFLQQSYADDESIRFAKQENFDKCLQFIRSTGRFWPRIAQLAEKVEVFQRIVTESSQSAAAAGDGKTYIDLSLFREILESCFTSELSAGLENYFGSTLRSQRSMLGSTDVVNGRLLPLPTRLDRNASATNTPFVSALSDPSNSQDNLAGFPSVDDQLQVLAQSYFAQGQDFVNFDDWWYPEQNIS